MQVAAFASGVFVNVDSTSFVSGSSNQIDFTDVF